MTLTLEEANRVMEGAIAKGRELGIKLSVAVVDGGGRLVAFNRMDGAIWAGVHGSQGKAVTAAAYGRNSGLIDASLPIHQGIIHAEGGRIIPGKGGVPIIRNGVVDGACGTGGGTGDQDEVCAAAGVACL